MEGLYADLRITMSIRRFKRLPTLDVAVARQICVDHDRGTEATFVYDLLDGVSDWLETSPHCLH